MEDNKQNLDNSLKLMVKSSFFVFIALILSKILAYSYRILVARSFGPEVYGLFTLAVMISGWFIVFSSLGLNQGLLRYISLYRGKKEINKIRFIFKISSKIVLFSTLLSAIILFFLAQFISINLFHNPGLIIFLKLFSIIIPLFAFSNIFLSILRAYEKITWYSFILNILYNSLKLIILLILIFLGIKTNAVIFSYLLGILIMLIVSYLVCKYKISEIFGKDNLPKEIRKNIAKEFFSYSWPVLFFGFFGGILPWIDSFVIGYFKGASDVGFYNAAIPLVFLLGISQELFVPLFFPLITREYAKKNFKLVKELTKQIGKWIFLLNLPLLIMIILFPGALINIFFGSEYLFAANALRILVIGAFFANITVLSVNLISMVGKTKVILINTLITCVFNTILNIFLVPKYGIDGAAFSTTISWIFFGIIFVFQANHYTSIIPLRRKMLRILIISFIPTFLLIFTKQFIRINLISIILLGVFFYLSYFLLIFLTKCLDKNDFIVLKSIWKKIFIKNKII